MPGPAPSVVTGTTATNVQLRNVKRSGLIRPSSGYYSNIRRTDFGVESGKCSSSNVSYTNLISFIIFLKYLNLSFRAFRRVVQVEV